MTVAKIRGKTTPPAMTRRTMDEEKLKAED
jgi:hypothetical protein